MDWRNRAACLDKDPELFFPVGNTGPALLQIEEAKSVCRRCPVVDTCLQWALESGQDAGVWGGMSEDERRALKRRAARARRAPDPHAGFEQDGRRRCTSGSGRVTVPGPRPVAGSAAACSWLLRLRTICTAVPPPSRACPLDACRPVRW